MKSAVTISLVAEARGGPFVFWDGLEAGCAHAAALGFDAVEIFPPGPEALDPVAIRALLDRHGLGLAAVGTGAGWVKHKLRLTDPDPAVRQRAREFAGGVVAVAGALGAPAIIGSMQGRCDPGTSRGQVLGWLGEALQDLAARAAVHGQALLFEPLNRYESDVFCRQAEAAQYLRDLAAPNLRVLCDLFHMNIEEKCLADTLRAVGDRVGHVHWADTNRHAVGFGHLEPAPVIAALREIGYTGYLSAEVLPLPDSVAAARQSQESFRRWTGRA